MSVLQNINGSLYRMDASDLVQLAAVDTHGILGGAPGATTDGQTLVDQLAADDVQAQSDIGQIKTDLPNYLTIADEQVLGAWNVLAVPATLVTSTNNGVTFTITRDSGGQVTEVDADGTAGTGGSRFTFISNNIIRKGRYYAKNGTGYSINYQENGVVNHSGNTDDFVVDWSQDIACRIVWDIAANTQLNHVKFYPQLALKPNIPYVPAAMTNANLSLLANNTMLRFVLSNLSPSGLILGNVAKYDTFLVFWSVNAESAVGVFFMSWNYDDTPKLKDIVGTASTYFTLILDTTNSTLKIRATGASGGTILFIIPQNIRAYTLVTDNT